MGIRFHCHHCQHELHVKDFQAGKRGRCPECQGKFRIPLQDADYSLELETPSAQLVTTSESPIQAGNVNSRTLRANEQTSKRAVASSKTSKSISPPSPREVDKAQRPAATAHACAPSPQSTSQPASAPAHIATETSGNSPTSEPPKLPSAITSVPSAHWHVRPSTGGQYGPAPAETMGQWLIDGRVAVDAYVWRDDWTDWQTAGSAFADYFGPLPTPHSTTAPDLSGVGLAAPLPAAPSTTLSERNRLERKKKKRQRYILIVSILAFLFIGLLVALARVLLFVPTE